MQLREGLAWACAAGMLLSLCISSAEYNRLSRQAKHPKPNLFARAKVVKLESCKDVEHHGSWHDRTVRVKCKATVVFVMPRGKHPMWK